MRELIFKNMTAWNGNKKDILVKEIVEKDGVLAKTSRRCLYFIKDKIRINDPSDLKKIASLNLGDDRDNRHFLVLKEHDSKEGIDKMMCKVAGRFYAVVNEYLYCIVFIHTFKISFTGVS